MGKVSKKLLKEIQKELNKHILPFWIEKMIDREQGGFYGRIDGNDQVIGKADKGSILNARILWTFSAAFNFAHEPKYLQMANRSFDYCKGHFINQEGGGVYWLLDYTGRPVERNNQIYALAFMIYGMSEYYRATGIAQAIEDAVNLYHKIEEYSFDSDNQGYYEAFDENWTMLEDSRLGSTEAKGKKSMNTHLHILEAYTNLYKSWEDEQLKMKLKNLILLFLEKIVDHNTGHFNLFFNEKWNPESKVYSFGHDIEGSWLLCEAANVLNEPELVKETTDRALKIVDIVMEEGFDADGGLFYKSDGSGIVDSDKHWWPQAEAMVGLVNAWQLTYNEKYINQAIAVWDFIKKHIVDENNGEWYYRVSKENTPFPEEDKAGIWKGPYHNSRACIEILKRIKG